MLGSLGEWYHAVYIDYPDGPQVDPKPTLNSSDEDIYSRGGNWGNNAEYIRNSTRATSFPNYEFFFLGFRTVKEVL